MLCWSISRTPSAAICTTSSSATLDWGILIGYVAQIMFAMRFVVQWIASERAGKSVVPTAFWVFSIGGGLMLLGYALYRKDPVFIIGQAFGVFVYLRNLQFVMRSGGTAARRLTLMLPPARQSRARDRRSGRRGLPGRYGSAASGRPAPMWSRCGTSLQSNGITRLSKPPHEIAHAEQRQRVHEGVDGLSAGTA